MRTPESTVARAIAIDVHCPDTAGTSDLDLDTRLLTEALRSFCAEIRAVAAEYDVAR